GDELPRRLEPLLRSDPLSPRGSRERVLRLAGRPAQGLFANYFREFSPPGVSSTEAGPSSTGEAGLSTGQGVGLWIAGGSQTAARRSTAPEGRNGVPSSR